jgi:selenocysteine lyase/cysteine desulfurase
MKIKPAFSRFLAAHPSRLHFAAHSHHPWPDVSFDAHQQAWLDAAQLADLKWDKVFDEIIPKAQAHVARVLNLPDPKSIAFAPSTHELVMRLLSCLPRARLPSSPMQVLTTDSEFHSFTRQMKRLEEDRLAQVTRVPVEPYETFAQRFADEAGRRPYDLVYFSQCFYNTAFRIADPEPLVKAVRSPEAFVVIDGYHAFMAAPADLSRIATRAFYTAGGYKYAMAGEGACFMHCPPGYAARPLNTGWFASFGTLTQTQNITEVPYTEGGLRFMGATFDPSALYRFNAVQDWLLDLGIGVAQIRAQVEKLQQQFLELCDRTGAMKGAQLMPLAGTARGNFLVFRHRDAQDWHRKLLEADVVTDCRDDRLRIGFGIYQDAEDVGAAVARIKQLGL